MADAHRKPRPHTRLLKDPILKVGKPIEMRFPIPLDAREREELQDRLRGMLPNREACVSVSGDKVVVRGVLVRDSKPVKDFLIRFKNSVSPIPIRLRPPGG